MTENLPRKLVKRIRGECQHCAQPAVEGSDYCEAHRAKERAADADRHQRRRDERMANGLCIVATCDRRAAQGERRCRRCAKEHAGAMRALREMKRGIPSGERGVPSTGADPASRRVARTKIERAYDRLVDGTERTIARVVYRQRGGQTVESMDADGAHDVVDAQRLLAGHAERLRTLRAVEVELGRIQRMEARAAAADPLLRALGLIAAEAARLCPDGWALVRERILAVTK